MVTLYYYQPSIIVESVSEVGHALQQELESMWPGLLEAKLVCATIVLGVKDVDGYQVAPISVAPG